MTYKDFSLGDWIGHISGAIEDERELDGNEMRDLLDFLTKLPRIPENATNGDVIKAVFPNIEIIINTETHEVTVDDSVNTYMHFFDLDWWNAPYKGR